MVATNVSNPPIPQSSLIDAATGHVSEAWWIFFSQLWIRTGGQSDAVNAASPVGAVVPFAGSTVPDTWLECDGSNVSRTTYNDLFLVIGTTFGVGDGSTTFGLPDLRGRAPVGVGQGSGLTDRVLGATGGVETVTLTTAEMPEHNHDFVNSGNTDEIVSLDHNHDLVESGNETNILGFSHNHDIIDPAHDHSSSAGNFVNDAAGTEYLNTGGDKGTTSADTATSTTGIIIDEATATSDGTTWDTAILGDGTLRDGSGIDMGDVIIGDTGSGGAHENMMPFLALKMIIKYQ